MRKYTEKWKRELTRHTDVNLKRLYKIYEQSLAEQAVTKERKWEMSRFREDRGAEEIQVERIEGQQDLNWVSASDASVGKARAGVAIAGCQKISYQKEVLLKEPHPGLGGMHGVYEQFRAATNHEGEVYVTSHCQGIVLALRGTNTELKFRKNK